MASPLGHALTGLILHTVSARDQAELRRHGRALGLVVLAGAADFDLLGRFVFGRSIHHGPTHGLGFALSVGVAVWLWGRAQRRPEAGRLGLLAGIAWGLHGLVDFVSRDTNPPIGPMVLWPFSERYWTSPFIVFLDTARTLTWGAVETNLLAMLWESALLAPLLLALWRLQRRRLR